MMLSRLTEVDHCFNLIMLYSVANEGSEEDAGGLVSCVCVCLDVWYPAPPAYSQKKHMKLHVIQICSKIIKRFWRIT